MLNPVKSEMLSRVIHKYLEEQYKNNQNQKFYIFRTDTNEVLQRNVVSYERAKEISNLYRQRLKLKWDQVSFKRQYDLKPKKQYKAQQRPFTRDPRYASSSTDAGRKGLYRGASRVKYWTKDWDE